MLRKLEKYELLEEIGHGGMATVFRGRDERLDRLVAVKVLHPHLQKAPEARIRFTREALRGEHNASFYAAKAAEAKAARDRSWWESARRRLAPEREAA